MRKILRPYLFISACGILAFAPVSFMLRALKNDIITLEYPINHFISQCIRNGEIPYWFNTWGMGFPLQSNLTWGIYSTPQLFFSSAFDYNIYTLHVEFLFFILLSGWSMFYLLKHFFVKDEKLAQLLAVCYMLSGFMAGSSQWLLYITAAAFVPLLFASLLKLLQSPSASNAIQVAVCYTIMFTSVYAAFNIITTYGIAIFLAIWLWRNRKERQLLMQRIRFLLLAAAMAALLCFPCLYFTLELLQHLDRGDTIAADASFFNSNYLHPGALSTMLFPFSSVRMGYANTEGTMLNTYAGIFMLTVLPVCVWLSVKERNKTAFFLLLAALFFLVVSFGDATPIRKMLNLLPGFSYFRNPAIFRFYFILALILFVATILQNRKFPDVASEKIFKYTLWLVAAISVLLLLLNANSLKDFSGFSFSNIARNINYPFSIFISALVQLLIALVLLWLLKMRQWPMARLVFAADLVINTLLCSPFFTVSSYSLPQVNNLLKTSKGFPVQHQKPGDVTVSYIDEKGNTWHNLNVFSKKVAKAESYPGPLVLKTTGAGNQPGKTDQSLVFYSGGDSLNHSIKITTQRPNHIRAEVRTEAAGKITLLQNYYPGWKAYINHNQTEIAEKGVPGLTINIPAGKFVIDFKYQRKEVWLSALLVHFVIIVFGLFKLKDWIKKTRTKSSSLS